MSLLKFRDLKLHSDVDSVITVMARLTSAELRENSEMAALLYEPTYTEVLEVQLNNAFLGFSGNARDLTLVVNNDLKLVEVAGLR